jgi:hypothetical protein
MFVGSRGTVPIGPVTRVISVTAHRCVVRAFAARAAGGV